MTYRFRTARFAGHLILAAFFPALHSVPAHADSPTVQWHSFSFPPVMIRDGAKAWRGFADRSERLIRAQLPEFRHESVDTPLVRILDFMGKEDAICTSNLFKTPEREKVAVFSRPAYVVDTIRIIALEQGVNDLAPYMRDGKLDVAGAMGDPRVSFAGLRKRAYSKPINAAIDKNPDRFVDVSQLESAFDMLGLNRVTMTAAFPWQAKWFLNDKQFFAFETHGAPDLMVGYFACSKGPIGRSVIAKINDILRRPDVERSLSEYYLEWIPPSNHDRYRARRADMLRQFP